MSQKVTIVGTIATTGYIEKYHARFSLTVLEQIRDRLVAGEFPLQLQHDAFRPWEAEIGRVWIEEGSDGEHAVMAEFTVEKDLYDEMAEEFERKGGPGGFSFSASTPQATLTAAEGAPSTVPVHLSADFAAWEDVDRLEAGRILRNAASVEVSQFFELSAAEDVARVIIEIPGEIWDELLLGVGANFLTEALKFLVRKRRTKSVIEIRDDRAESRKVARIETDDQEIVEDAIASLGGAAPAETLGNFEFDPERGLWVPRDVDR
jgi:hypothetical protein